MSKNLKWAIKLGLPILGSLCLACGATVGIYSIIPSKSDKVIYPNKIDISANFNEVTVNTNQKWISPEPIKVVTQPANANKNIKFEIENSKLIDTTNKIYVDNEFHLVIDKNISSELNDVDFVIHAHAKNSSGEDFYSEEQINFKLNVNYVPSNVLDVDWNNKGSTFFSFNKGEINYASIPWTAKIQKKTGQWSIGGYDYEIVSDNPETSKVFAIDKDGYLYSTGQYSDLTSYTFKIKAIAQEDETYFVLSDEIKAEAIPNDEQTAKIDFTYSFNQAVLNYHGQYLSTMPFVASAYDKNDIKINQPSIIYSIIDDKTRMASIDEYGYLRINAINVSSDLTAKFKVRAMSAKDYSIYKDVEFTVVVMDKRGADLFNFDPSTGTILSLQPKAVTDIVRKSGIWEIPQEISGIPVKSLSSNVFENIEALKEITLPSTLESIGDDCFAQCKNLSKITINSNVKLSPHSLATGTNTKLICANQDFANSLPDTFQVSAIPEIQKQLTIDGFCDGFQAGWDWKGHYSSTRKIGTDERQDGSFSIDYTYNTDDLLSIIQFSPLYSQQSKLTNLTIESSSGITLPSGIQDNINMIPQYVVSKNVVVGYEKRWSDPYYAHIWFLIASSSWGFNKTSYYKYSQQYLWTEWSTKTINGDKFYHSNLVEQEKQNLGEGFVQSQGFGEKIGTSIQIYDGKNNLVHSMLIRWGHYTGSGTHRGITRDLGIEDNSTWGLW